MNMLPHAPSAAGIEQALGYVFQNKSLLSKALHHASLTASEPDHAFERLEFLGDRVLGLAIADLLYHRYTCESEAALAPRLSVLVSRLSLTAVARRLGLEGHLSFNQQKGHPKLLDKILADGMEALLGAVFLDGGWLKARDVVTHLWCPLLGSPEAPPPRNIKSALQEWVQAAGKALPVYETLATSGPDHAPRFVVQVTVEGVLPCRAEGDSKKQAEIQAAQMLLYRLQDPAES